MLVYQRREFVFIGKLATNQLNDRGKSNGETLVFVLNKRLRVLKTQVESDFTYGQFYGRYPFLAFFDQFVVDVLLGTLAR